MSSSVNYSTGCDGGGNENSGKLAPSQAAECNVVLGLNMQYTESTYPIKKINFMSNPSLYHHPQHRTSIQFGGGPRLFDNSTDTSNQIAAGSCFKYTTSGEFEKMVFTASQLQEFEKQTMIYKHIISSIPVPPHLLVPLSTQSNRSDSEPWRCKRTDGKKWRCSRDVMPDQRYCERHAHKNRPRSRKPVETQSQNIKNLNSKHNYHSTLPPAPSIPTSCQQSRCKEWFMKPMCSPSVESKRDHIFQNLEGNIQDLFERDSCSLTLMHPGGNDTFNDQDQDFFQMGMLNEDGSNPHNQWVNQDSWLGGPLGEALCSLNRPPNVSAPHDAGCGLH